LCKEGPKTQQAKKRTTAAVKGVRCCRGASEATQKRLVKGGANERTKTEGWGKSEAAREVRLESGKRRKRGEWGAKKRRTKNACVVKIKAGTARLLTFQRTRGKRVK